MKKRTLALLLAGAAVGAACAVGTIAACVLAYKSSVKQEDEEDDHDLLDEQNLDYPETTACYYAEHGNVYHMDRNCPHIVNHDQIISSTVAEAMEAGKLRQCTLCGE